MAKELAHSIGARGRSKAYHKRGVWAVKAKNGGKLPVHPKKPVAKHAAAKRTGRFYAPEDVPKPLPKRVVHKPTKLRSTITPGTVLILLAGRFKGKRVVFLKQLESGLLLVTGPFKVNGVPTRRVNQTYVIATSTKIDVSKVDVSKFDDAYFKRPAKVRSQKGEDGFFQADEAKKELPASYIEDNKALDAALKPIIDAVPDLAGYLAARFSLKSGQYPHLMKF